MLRGLIFSPEGWWDSIDMLEIGGEGWKKKLIKQL